MTSYRQCELRRGKTVDIVWIPEVFAKEGAWLRIHGEDGWLVRFVFGRSNGNGLFSDKRNQRQLFGSLA